MNKVLETSAEIPVVSEISNLECKTPPPNQKQSRDENSQNSAHELHSNLECKRPPPNQKQSRDENSQNSAHELRKPTTPDLLKVPKAFKYPERYKSPTDLMMSPITRGLLARSRRGGAVLPPSLNDQNKVSPDVGLFP